MQHHHLSPGEWDQLATDPEFVSLLQARRRFVLPCTVLFIALFLALPLGIAFAPGFMNAPVLGPLTVAYAYGLFQFALAWVLLALYMYASKRFDARVQEISARCAGKSASA
jgi:uncharacterized membrane protein (DUF485 family)